MDINLVHAGLCERLEQNLRLGTHQMRIEESLRNNNARILSQVRENDLLRAQRDSFIQQARTIGKITQYLAGVTAGQDDSGIVRMIEEARQRVRALEGEIDGESDQERIDASFAAKPLLPPQTPVARKYERKSVTA